MSKAERIAQKWFHKFNEHRMLFGFSAMLILTACSIYFNFRLGELNANPGDKTSIVMPLSYSFLDVSALVLAMCLFGGLIRSGILKLFSAAWFGYLVALSLFACLSCIIALDAKNSAHGDDFRRAELVEALAVAKANVETWQSNVDKTVKHKSRFQAQLNAAINERDDLINKVSRMDQATPASQTVFEVALPFMPVWMDEDQFRLLARLAFGVAMIITPLVLTGVLAHVLGDGRQVTRREEAVESLGKPQTNNMQPDWSSNQEIDYGGWSEHDVVNYTAPSEPKNDNVVLFEDRRPQTTGQTSNKTRKTGLDRDVARRIEDYLANGSGPIGQKAVAEKFGVGKGLLVQVYQKVAGQGLIYKSGQGARSPWRRTRDKEQTA